MKLTATLIFISLILIGCSGESEQSLKEKELELKERELALKEKEMALDEKESTNSINNRGRTSPQKTKPTKSERQLQQELFEKECNNPMRYLAGKLNIKPKFKNIISTKVDGAKLEVTIRNKASFATYKNIKAEVEFKSNSGATILKREFHLYEYFPARTTKTFKREVSITNQQWDDFDTFDWKMTSAECNQ